MADSFWMENDDRTGWEEAALNSGSFFRRSDKSASGNKLSFRDSKIREFMFRQAQYPLSDTGSQYLDMAWRQNIVKISTGPLKIRVAISLN